MKLGDLMYKNKFSYENTTKFIVMGGRGGKSGSHKSYSVSPLTAFRENSKQFSNALQEGRTRKASIVEFTDITGKVSKRYWNGATYTDRSSSLYEKEFKGTHKVSFKKPKDW